MSEHEVIESLQELGFTEYQSRAYLAAVKLGRARPGELAEESGVPQARIYDIIDDLKSEGVIEVFTQANGKEVTAPSPQTVLNQLKRRRTDQLEENVSTTISEIEPYYHRTEENPDAYVTMVGREESALRHARQAIEQAEWWLTLVIDSELYPKLSESIRDTLDRNVTVRLVLTGDRSTASQYEFPHQLRVRFRTAADSLIAADRTYGIFSSKHPARSGQPYVITQEPNLVLLFQNYSEQIWPVSETIHESERRPRRYLDPWHVIADLKEEFEMGTDFHAHVTGTHTDTHRQGAWEGRVVDYNLTGPVGDDYETSLPVEASLLIDTDEETLSIGGWKATLEDVAAEGLEITRF